MGYENNKEFNIIKLIIGGSIIGTIFGFLIQRCNVYLPSLIKDQMGLTNFTMLKVFLSFLISSSLSITFLDYFKIIKLNFLPVIYKRNFIGGFIMGIGIFISGACPGTILAQLPEFNDRIYTLIGGLIGAIAYGYSDEFVKKLLPIQINKKQTIFQYLNVQIQYVTIPISIINIVLLYIIEIYYPLSNDSKIWSPYTTGIIIGLLQIPSFLIYNGGIGASTAYVTFSSLILEKFIKLLDYFIDSLKLPKSLFQLVFDIFIILGAYLSSLSNPAPINGSNDTTSITPTITTIFINSIGGFLLIYGARFADGCTSGSVTNMAKTEIGAFITTFSLFTGGILTCYTYNLIN